MLSAAVDAATIGGVLDAVLSVDPIRIYKPRPEVYALVTERFGLPRNEIVFVSSNRWDVAGARAFGFRTAWINRAGLPDEYPDMMPDLTARELTDVGRFEGG